MSGESEPVRGNRTYIITVRRITSGDVLKYRNGFLIHRRYETGLTASSQFALTPPRPRPEDETGIDYDTEGRINGALLANLIRNDDAHYYLCGPTRFMADLQTDLERRDIPSEYIHTETFGPVG